MNRQQLLKRLDDAWAALKESYAGLADSEMMVPGVVGEWSVKDILAHLTAWQSELVTALSQLDNPKRVPEIIKIDDLDEWNEEQYRTNARRSLQAVREDFQGVHKHLLKAVEELDNDTLENVRKFPWMEGEPLWYLIAENGYWHEEEHADQVRRWRDEQGI